MIGLIRVKITLPFCRRYLFLAGGRVLPSSKEMLGCMEQVAKALSFKCVGLKVEDANGYPQVNPNEKRIADFMKVSVP